LYLKNSEEQEAIRCFEEVAEHYNTQGFSQKAIAVYNKISRLKPKSMEITAKLARLYQMKGSFSEARLHYTELAEYYQGKGQKIEALTIWKQIAELDPHNTDIYLKIASVYLEEDQKDEAAKAFTEAGSRLFVQKQYEAALEAFTKTLEIHKYDLVALKGYVNAQIKLDDAEEAAKTLEKILEEYPYNREILFLLIDCYIDSNNPASAEKAVVKLVEQEPANYPKFLELVEIYLKQNDLDSAARILSMSSEYLLVGGQAEEFLQSNDEILARNPEHLDALRLSVRYHSWQRDEKELKKSLERLAEVARHNESHEDERQALAHLVMISPHEVSYAQRLQEIKAEYGFEEPDAQPLSFNESNNAVIPLFENFAMLPDDAVADTGNHIYKGDLSEVGKDFNFASENEFHSFENFEQNGASGNDSNDFVSENLIAEDYFIEAEELKTSDIVTDSENTSDPELKLSDRLRLQQEVESIEFYIAQGYEDLAEKSLSALENEFGSRREIARLRQQLNGSTAPMPVSEVNTVKESAQEIAEFVEEIDQNKADGKSFDVLDKFRDDLGFEETEAQSESDYETHYHMAIAYKEMGLMEDSIKEFQDAINQVEVNDGTRRFFQCCNLLGHCFMEKTMPNLAIIWFKKGLETANLRDQEQHALNYEIANAYETGGDMETAIGYFEKIYAENVDYRDVSGRLQKLKENNMFQTY
jgi:tetratricopeptide (TPR) repeat protein